MIQISLKELRPGQVLAKSIYRDSGEIMLSSGYRMTPDVNTKLAEMGIDRIWVQEEGLEDLDSEDLVSELTINQCVLALRKAFIDFRSAVGLLVGKPDDPVPSPQEILSKPDMVREALNLSAYRKVASMIFQELKKADPSLLHLNCTRSSGNFLFQSAIECSIIAAFLAKRYAFNPDEVEDLILATTLMDVGYFLLPDRLLVPGAKLTLEDLELKKKHPEFGYEILHICSVPLVCAHVALQHHERQDGGGFPRKLRGNNAPPVKTAGAVTKGTINRYAEIVAVAHDYLMLIAPPHGIPEQTPIQSIKFLVRLGGSKLNSNIVEMLLSMIPVYSAGNRIMITEDPTGQLVGYTGVIMRSNPREQNRPSVALIYNKTGERIPAMQINLWERKELAIREAKLGEAVEQEQVSPPELTEQQQEEAASN